MLQTNHVVYIEPATLNDYQSIELRHKQIKLLKEFKKLEFIEFNEGRTPQDVIFLAHYGLIQIHKPEIDYVNETEINRTFHITAIGTMYLIYKHNVFVKIYIPIFISIISLLLSSVSSIFNHLC